MIPRDSWRRRPGRLPERLAAELRDQIGQGRIGPGSPLPAERQLAEAAGVSRTTVSAAVDLLVASGWADRRDRARAVARLPGPAGHTLAPTPHRPDRVRLDLLGAMTSAPVSVVDAAVDRARSRLVPRLLGDGREEAGLADLREAVAGRFTAGGLPTSADEVLVTNGAIGALTSILDAVTGRVVVEDPTYHLALRVLAAKRRAVIGWPRFGPWDLDTLDRIVRTRSPGVAYLVPDFHNPTGLLAADDERSALAPAAARIPAVVIDETLRDLDLRRAGDGTRPDPPDPVAVHVPGVITIGGLSKIIWSGLRVGWLRDTDRRRRAELARFTAIQPPPLLDQLVAVELWDHLDAVNGARVERLRHQRDILVAGLRAAGLTVDPPPGGLVVWLDLGRPVAAELTRRLATVGVVLADGGMFGVAHPADRYVRIPFTHDPATLTEVVGLVTTTLAAIP